MKKYKVLSGCLLLLIASSCKNNTSNNPPSIQVSTDSEIPGETVYIKYDLTEKINTSELKVFFDSAEALIINNNPDSTMEVMIPKIAAGNKKVSVRINDKTIAQTDFTIEPAPSIKLLLEYSNGKFKLLQKSEEYNVRSYEQRATDHMMLFDVDDASGKNIASGAFENPGFGSHEVFDKKDAIHREKPMAGMPEHVSIVIPNNKGKLSLKFFEIEQPEKGLTYILLQKDDRVIRTKKLTDQITIDN